MALDNLKNLVLHNKEVIMFFVGFGVIHYGWYSLQRNNTLNNALAASRTKEIRKEYKRLEKEINSFNQQNIHEEKDSGVILNAAIAYTNKSTNTR